MICPKCGSELSKSSKFCGSCGFVLSRFKFASKRFIILIVIVFLTISGVVIAVNENTKSVKKTKALSETKRLVESYSQRATDTQYVKIGEALRAIDMNAHDSKNISEIEDLLNIYDLTPAENQNYLYGLLDKLSSGIYVSGNIWNIWVNLEKISQIIGGDNYKNYFYHCLKKQNNIPIMDAIGLISTKYKDKLTLLNELESREIFPSKCDGHIWKQYDQLSRIYLCKFFAEVIGANDWKHKLEYYYDTIDTFYNTNDVRILDEFTYAIAAIVSIYPYGLLPIYREELEHGHIPDKKWIEVGAKLRTIDINAHDHIKLQKIENIFKITCGDRSIRLKYSQYNDHSYLQDFLLDIGQFLGDSEMKQIEDILRVGYTALFRNTFAITNTLKAEMKIINDIPEETFENKLPFKDRESYELIGKFWDGYTWKRYGYPIRKYLCENLAMSIGKKTWKYYYDVMNTFYDTQDSYILYENVCKIASLASEM